MTARQFAKLVGFEVVGKLTRVPMKEPGASLWIDEAGNEYVKTPTVPAFKFSKWGCGWYIITADGGVI